MVGHGNTVQDRLQRQELAFEDLMQRLGDVPEGFNVVDALLQTRETINALTVQMEETRAKVSSVGDVESLRNEVASSRAEITTLQSEIGVLKKAVGSSNTQTVQKSSRGKVKVPEPKPYRGSRSSKDLENFLWDVEQYFKAVDFPACVLPPATCPKNWCRLKRPGDDPESSPVAASQPPLRHLAL